MPAAASAPPNALPAGPWEDEILSPRETAKEIDLSEFTLMRMRQSPDAGGLPYVQLSPGRIGYRRGDIRAFLLSRRVGTLANEPPKALPFAKPSGRGRPRRGVLTRWSPKNTDDSAEDDPPQAA
jgi:hypothetical protein